VGILPIRRSRGLVRTHVHSDWRGTPNHNEPEPRPAADESHDSHRRSMRGGNYHSEVRFSGGRAGVTNRMARPHQPSTNTKHLEGGKRISWNCCHLPVPAPYERGVESRWRGGARTAVEGSTYWISIAAVGIRCILSGRDGQSAMFARDGTHSDHTWHFVTIHIS